MMIEIVIHGGGVGYEVSLVIRGRSKCMSVNSSAESSNVLRN
jgi:hypothetical protein